MLTFRPEAHRINVNNNYSYDEEGRLVKDSSERISKIVWRVDGKVKEIQRNGGTAKWLKFDYDAMGHRIAKHVFSTNGTTLEKSTYYILDAQGNQISTYDHEVVNNTVQFNLKERNIFGSSRIGSKQDSMNVLNTSPKANYTLILGRKFYEFTNHLGNVLTVFTDLKIPQDTDNNNVVDNYKIGIVRTADYSPFGVTLDGRTKDYEIPIVTNGTPGVIYQHKFDDSPNAHPYTGTPSNLDPNLTQVSWTNSLNAWTNYTGHTGRAIAINSATPDTTKLYLNLTVNPGYLLDISSYSFYHRSSSTGYTNYKLYINNILIGNGSIFVSSGSTLQHTGTVNVLNAIAGLSGSITVRFDLFGGSNGSNGTFRMDNFVLNGYTTSVENWSPEGYRYGFQNQEEDSETGLVNYKYRMHDPRVGRFFAVDPLASKYPYNGTYNFSENRVLDGVELEGLEWNPLGNNPLYAIAEGFRRLGEAFGRVFSAKNSTKLEVTQNKKVNVGGIVGNGEVYQGVELEVQTNLEDFFKYQKTDLTEIVEVSTKLFTGARLQLKVKNLTYEYSKEVEVNSREQTTKDENSVEGQYYINGVPVNMKIFEIKNSKGEKIKDSEMSAGIKGNKFFLSISEEAQSNFIKSKKLSFGGQVSVETIKVRGGGFKFSNKTEVTVKL
jgi:RHS repeat-associated protein